MKNVANETQPDQESDSILDHVARLKAARKSKRAAARNNVVQRSIINLPAATLFDPELRRRCLMDASAVSKEASLVFIQRNFAVNKRLSLDDFEMALHIHRLRTFFAVEVDALTCLVAGRGATYEICMRFTRWWRLSLDGMIDSGEPNDESVERLVRSGAVRMPTWNMLDVAFQRDKNTDVDEATVSD